MTTALGETPVDWPNALDEAPMLQCVVTDMENDGSVDLVVPAGWTMWVLDLGIAPSSAAARNWSQAGHDRGKSGCADCAPGTPTGVGPGSGARLVVRDGAVAKVVTRRAVVGQYGQSRGLWARVRGHSLHVPAASWPADESIGGP